METASKVQVPRGDSVLNATLIDGKLEGPARIVESGQPQAILTYRQGVLEGPMVTYHSNGQPSARLMYRQDKLHGQAVFHSAEGVLIREAQYRGGLMHGLVTSYFPDGTLASREQYRQGQLNGVCQRYHSNGGLAARMEYDRGKVIDGARSFAADGRPLDAKSKPIPRWKAWWQSWHQPPDS